MAADGSAGSKNGLYTGYLLKELQKPTAKIEEVFKRVRFAVRKESGGSQVPWETTSLEDDFVFNSGIKKVVKLSDEDKEKQFALEKADWDKIKESKEVNDYYAFVQKYPKGLLLQSAMGVIERLSAAKTVAYSDRNGVSHSARPTLYRVGDEVERVRRDLLTDKEVGKHKLRVVSVAGGVVSLVGGSVISSFGEDIYNAGTGDSYDPPRPFLPADGMNVGKKWAARSTITLKDGRKSWEEVEGKVVAFESVTTQAGTFKTYKIEQTGSNGFGTKWQSIYWSLPNLGFSVKSISHVQRGSGKNESWGQEATSVKIVSQ